jgi:hypothetical protein
MRIHTAILCAAILLGCTAAASAQAVSLKFDNGRVSLNAQEASIRTILAEWARVGGTRMVNHDRISGAPVTLELIDVPERQALDVLLRTTAGYVVTARDASSAGASRLGGVVILPTSSAPRNPAPITFANAPLLPQAQAFENMVQPRDDEQNQGNANRTVNVAPFPLIPGPSTGPAVVRVGSGVTTFGAPSTTAPTTTSTPGQQGPTRSPQVLPGTSRPGEITPPPPQQPNPR